MHGSKNYASVDIKQRMQKQLLLVILKELYSSFLKEHAGIKLRFSKFCQMQPKWCVLLGASGTQNMKLILDPLNLEYKDLLKFLVCDPGNKYCMIHQCPNSPDDEEQLYIQYLKETIEFDCMLLSCHVRVSE